MPSVPSLVVGTVGLLLRRRRCSHATRHRRRRQCCPRRRVTLKTFNIDSIHYQVVVIAAHPPPPPTTSTTPSTVLGTSHFDSSDHFQALHAVTILKIALTSALQSPTSQLPCACFPASKSHR
ncbi:hypothetical protein C8R43DRAFT_1121969 [Mycena crocata]|nr:hypothetical protein C8R43DRAFT_1121969 [Mycena crocata]